MMMMIDLTFIISITVIIVFISLSFIRETELEVQREDLYKIL